MISFRLHVDTPWKREFFRNLGSLHGKLSKNLAWEIEHTYYSDALVDAEFELCRQQDHAGLEIVIGVLGYGIGVRLYDIRHWNEQEQTWGNHCV